MKKEKFYFYLFAINVIICLSMVILTVVAIDPFFHYHKPIESLFYKLDNQRYMNHGIVKHFEYDSIITGTSMTENFMTSEFDRLFNANSVKITFSGGTYKEINDVLNVAFKNNKNIKYVLRGLDYSMIMNDKDALRTDLGEYPSYLYDEYVFNDYKYWFDKTILFDYIKPMLSGYFNGNAGGITHFDEYSNWMQEYADKFGYKYALKGIEEFVTVEQNEKLTDEEMYQLKENIEQNVISISKDNPNTEFIYFFTPYSIAWWGNNVSDGTLMKWLEIEKVVIELIVPHENIKLYSFNLDEEIIADLNNYKDIAHYGEWINQEILMRIANEENLITSENYLDYLEKEYEYFSEFNYNSLFNY